MAAGNINKLVEKWLKKTIWLWVPLGGLKILIADVIAKHDNDKESE